MTTIRERVTQMDGVDRLRQLAKHCRAQLGGGDCPCVGATCQARLGLQRRAAELAVEAKGVDELITHLERKLCTVRANWRMPDKPKGEYSACVINDGDGWTPHWYSETEKCDYIDFPPGKSSWPFVESYAFSDDWERLGFEVV